MIFFVRVLLGLYSRMPQNVIYVNTEEMDENTTDYINPTSLLDLRGKSKNGSVLCIISIRHMQWIYTNNS